MNFEKFEELIGYNFKDKHLLYNALTHSSYANENKQKLQSNERLEFLGDSVLSVVVAEFLYKNFKHLPEGELTKLRASLVCEKALYEFSKKIDLKDYLMLGKGEEYNGGRERPSIIADGFEAVIAAIFLDGGIEVAKEYILGFMPSDLDEQYKEKNKDYKTMLQEIVQRNPEEKVQYFLKGESGPDHDKSFLVEVKVNSNIFGSGVGHSKKKAEQNAAKEALKLMGYAE